RGILFVIRLTKARHPEVAAKRPSKDARPGPSPFEARWRSHLRVTGMRCLSFAGYDKWQLDGGWYFDFGRGGRRQRVRNESKLAGLDLQGDDFRIDAALCEAAGNEPQPGLRRAGEHVAELMVFAKAPDRAETFFDGVAEQFSHQ